MENIYNIASEIFNQYPQPPNSIQLGFDLEDISLLFEIEKLATNIESSRPQLF